MTNPAPTIVTASNGPCVIVEPLSHTYSVSIGCFLKVGARYEDAARSGIAHFLEHMCFKGTCDFPTPRSISLAIEGIGGSLDAETSYESTIYWSRVPDAHFDKALHVLTDMMCRPLLESQECEKERRVIIEEIRGLRDSPDDWVHTLFHETMWGDQPLGRDIAGSIDTVSSISRADLVEFWKHYYHRRDIIVSIAGNVPIDETIERVMTTFDGLSRSNAPPPCAELPIARPRPGPTISLLPRPIEQANFCIGFPGLSYHDPDRRALQVLDTVMGSGMSSRLFLEVREARGLSYYIGSYPNEFVDSGMWMISGGVEPERLSETLQTIGDMLREILAHGITDEELRRVKEQVKGGMLLSLETTWSVASRNASHYLRYGSIMPVEQIVAEIEAVTHQDVLRVAERIIRPDRLHLAIIGPYTQHDRDHFLSILANTSS